MADETAQIAPTDADIYGGMGLVRNPDGSFTRQIVFPNTTVSSYDNNPNLLVKDIPVNQTKNTWVRVFLPKEAIESSPSGTKLPLLIFIHGGGFVIGSPATTFFDEFHNTLTTDITAVVVSIEYRLAPEHKLPAAYEDCSEVLKWIKNSQDEWLTKYADFSNSFIMGNSAGGNIAYHVGLTASECADDLKPLNIKGLILHQPFLGGNKRTESELRGVNDKILPQRSTDLTWEVALPEGVDRDHKYCNPMMHVKSGQFDKIISLGWKILVAGYEGDPVFDRQVELAKVLEEKGVNVVGKLETGGYHGIEFYEFPKLKALLEVLKEFMKSIS